MELSKLNLEWKLIWKSESKIDRIAYPSCFVGLSNASACVLGASLFFTMPNNDHLGWSSHFKEIKDSMNTSRIWHFTWSSLYFESKFCRKSIIIKKLLKIISFSIFKLILNMIILRFRKVNQNLIKLSACFAFVLKRGSYFRVKHKVDKN